MSYSSRLVRLVVGGALAFCGVLTVDAGFSTGAMASENASNHSAGTASNSFDSLRLPITKPISVKELEKYQSCSVTIEESGKEIKYTGTPLRVLFAEMLPDFKIDVMPEWKVLNRQELVMEVTGDDGYVGLVPATDIAINKSGDRFLLATQKDGKAIESGVHLICKMDEARVRWIRSVVSLRLISAASKKQ